MRPRLCADQASSKRSLPRIGHLLYALMGLLALPSSANAGEQPGAHALLFGSVVQQRSFEFLSVGDTRPRSYGELGGRADLSYLLSDHWEMTLSGHVGGTWLDFNGFGVSGRVADQSWSLRAGLDRLVPLGERQTLSIGAGLEYGEGRSWLDTFTASSEGPHAYMTGGSVRLGLAHQLGSRVHIVADLSQSAYRAHAKEPSTLRTSYNWLGRSMAGSVGMRWAVLRGRRG